MIASKFLNFIRSEVFMKNIIFLLFRLCINFEDISSNMNGMGAFLIVRPDVIDVFLFLDLYTRKRPFLESVPYSYMNLIK